MTQPITVPRSVHPPKMTAAMTPYLAIGLQIPRSLPRLRAGLTCARRKRLSAGAATALLHDFDYEMPPTLDKHPQDGAPILREQGYPEELIEAVLSHAEHLGMPRDTKLKQTLFACDELAGFVHTCGLVRPDGIETLEPKSVRKKLKQPSFAAGVHREEVYRGAEELGVELDDHIRNVVAAMRPIAAELGLRTSAAA